MKAIIYCRKSTDREDRQVQSLDDQIAWCRETAKSLGYEVVEEISEAISAKTPEKRPGFKKMLKSIKEWKAEIIITWKCNRLARNPIDQSYIEWYLQEWTIKEIVSSDGFFRTGDNVLILRMHFWMSTQYSLDLSKDTMRGMRSKVEKGGIVAKPPLGYISINWEAKRGEFFDKIRKVYEWRNQGMSCPDIAEKLYKLGIKTKTGKQFTSWYIENVLKNPFYYWAIQWAWEIFAGKHEPLVSKDEWNRANNIKRGVIYKDHSENPLLRLKGIVIWFETGEIFTASLVKWQHVYFHNSSRSKKKTYINQNSLLNWFEANIEDLDLPSGFLEWLRPIFESFIEQENREMKSIRDQISTSEKRLEAEKAKLLKLRMNEEITQEEYLDEKNKIIEQLIGVRTSLLDYDVEYDKIMQRADNFITYCTNLSNIYKTADLSKKIDIVKSLCTNLWITRDKKVVVKLIPFWNAVFEANKNPLLWEDFWESSKWLPG